LLSVVFRKSTLSVLLTRERFVFGMRSYAGSPSVMINSAGSVETKTWGAASGGAPGRCFRISAQFSSAGNVSGVKGSAAAGVHAPLIGSELVIHPSPSRR